MLLTRSGWTTQPLQRRASAPPCRAFGAALRRCELRAAAAPRPRAAGSGGMGSLPPAAAADEAAAAHAAAEAGAYEELDDAFTGLAHPDDGLLTVAGFGSLLSERSARSTFPDLQNFRPARLRGWRRVFRHAAPVFFERGVARPETKEVSSLSCEPVGGGGDGQDLEIVVALFEVPFSPAAVAAFIEREHEFKFVAVRPLALAAPGGDSGGDGGGGSNGALLERRAVLCAANTDEAYRAARCPPDEWARRWGRWGIEKIWRDDVLPCRVYLRHCVLAARSLGPEAYASFLDATFLGDRKTTVRARAARSAQRAARARFAPCRVVCVALPFHDNEVPAWSHVKLLIL